MMSHPCLAEPLMERMRSVWAHWEQVTESLIQVCSPWGWWGYHVTCCLANGRTDSLSCLGLRVAL